MNTYRYEIKLTGQKITGTQEAVSPEEALGILLVKAMEYREAEEIDIDCVFVRDMAGENILTYFTT